MRTQFIITAASAILLTLSSGSAAHAEESKNSAIVTHRQYLRGIRYTSQEVDDWFAGKAFPFSKHHPQLGWLLPNRQFRDGIDDSLSTYTYSETGERQMVNYADRPCRINTYGDSFTQCHQVSDGETWQEVLAAHLQEPVRNFGIGGWSVYQAYLRMKMEEKKVPAGLIILNIYDDDHYRNLDCWRHIRVGKNPFHIGPTTPYLKVNLRTGECTECANVCPTQQSYYSLCDVGWLVEHFKDDFALNIVLAKHNTERGNSEYAYKLLEETAARHGLDKDRIDWSKPARQITEELHTRAALLSTMKIVEWVEEYAKANNKKVLYVLSYSNKNVRIYGKEGERFDREFVDFLKQRDLPVVDFLEAHRDDYQKWACELEYVNRYYIGGHYNPLGNFFTAFAIKSKVVEMLNPKPIPYKR